MNYSIAVCSECGLGFTADADKSERVCPLCGNKSSFKTDRALSVEVGRELYAADRALFSGDRKAAVKLYKRASKLDKSNPYPLFGIALAKHGVRFDGIAVYSADGKPFSREGAFKKAIKLKGGELDLRVVDVDPSLGVGLDDFDIDGDRLVHYGGSDERVLIPSSVTRISELAFLCSRNVKTVYIPSSVAYIESRAFTASPPIERFVVSPDNDRFKVDGGCLVDVERTILKRATPSAVIPSYVTAVDDYAFEKCDGIKEIVLPDGVQRLGEYAFGGCETLERVVIPPSLTKVEEGAFSFCSSLAEFEADESNPVLCVRDGGLYDKKTNTLIRCGADGKIPDGCERLSGAACDGGSFENLFIPATVTEIGDRVFEGCSSLKSLTVSAANPVYTAKGNCLIEKESGRLIAAAGKFDIPADGSVREIGEYAFEGAEIEEVVIPPSVALIAHGAFASSSLKRIKLERGLEEIGEYAFGDCAELESVELPDTVKLIGCEAFWNCAKLKRAVIPKSVECIESDAFGGCDELEQAVFEEIYDWFFDDYRADDEVSPQTLSVEEQAAELLVKDGRRIIRRVEGSIYNEEDDYSENDHEEED